MLWATERIYNAVYLISATINIMSKEEEWKEIQEKVKEIDKTISARIAFSVFQVDVEIPKKEDKKNENR